MNLKETLIAIISFIALYLFNKNKSLKKDNDLLRNNLDSQSKIANIQERVINETKNSENLDVGQRISGLQNYPNTRKNNKNKSSRIT